jgi:hypothetical protein
LLAKKRYHRSVHYPVPCIPIEPLWVTANFGRRLLKRRRAWCQIGEVSSAFGQVVVGGRAESGPYCFDMREFNSVTTVL